MIRLVAIDLDGTLFNSNSVVTPENRDAIYYLKEHGIYPVISTGRPFNGIPEILKTELPFSYAITANGSGIYEVSSGKCITSDGMDPELAISLLDYLDDKDIHLDAFIDGVGTSTFKHEKQGERLPVPEEIRYYIMKTRTRVESLQDYIREGNRTVQKMTMNFFPDDNGEFIDREEIRLYMEAHPSVDVVCGGFHNLEITKKGTNKGLGIKKLADYLGLAIDETMAIGDTENDLSIIEAAGIGVAMGNAIPMIKDAADYITASNDESGVAKAIYHFCK